MKITSLLVFLILFGLNTKANASEDGLYAFGGIGFGYSTVSESVLRTADRSGPHLDIKGNVSFYRPDFYLDAGLGWFYNKVKNKSTKINTRSAFLETSAYYRFNKNFSVGPILMAAINNDNSFAYQDNQKSSEYFTGLRVVYEPDLESNKLRFTGTFERDISISDRSVTLFMFGIEFGFPLMAKKSTPAPKKVATKKKKNVPKLLKIGKSRLRATFDRGTGLYFETGSARANPEMRAYVKRLAFFLNNYSKEWKTVEVAGHTDDVGRLPYNMKLSKKRADVFKSLLVKEDLQASRVVVKWFGPKKPLDNRKTAAARSINRRVELEFTGIKNVDSFHTALSIVQ